jgi:hypothetical protein
VASSHIDGPTDTHAELMGQEMAEEETEEKVVLRTKVKKGEHLIPFLSSFLSLFFYSSICELHITIEYQENGRKQNNLGRRKPRTKHQRKVS